MRKQILTLAGILAFFSLSATGDSLHYLTAKDTFYLSLTEPGRKIFEHSMERGQTLYSLSRFYGLRLDALLAFNPAMSADGTFSLGQKVKIPVPDSAWVKDWNQSWPRKNFTPVFYVVRQGDTFYSIATTHFKIPLDTLKTRNRLADTNVRPGQKLLLGWFPLKGIPEALQWANANPITLKMRQLQTSYEADKVVKKAYFQNGAAYWQREKKGQSDYYALHRSAPVGSVIQITNPMKRKTVYAKVIAAIPDQAYGDDIVAVLSPTIAKLLGARDPKFFVEVKYFK